MRPAPPNVGSADQLARALARVAGDPAQTETLYATFGGFCHEFRNGLNSLSMSLYLARRASGPEWDDVWSALEPRYTLVERFIDRFQLVCRPLRLTPVRLTLQALFDDRFDAWSTLLGARGRRLVVEPLGTSAPGAFDPMRLGSAFDDLVALRAEQGPRSTDLRVRWSTSEQGFRVDWDEPAATPPRPDGAHDKSEPKTPDSPQPQETDALAALTVPLLARVMTAHGGTLQTDESDGWRLTLCWPLDAQPTPREAPRCSASQPSP